MRNCLKITYIIVIILTIVFAMVELGLAGDLLWEINRRTFGLRGPARGRTRYLIFCSSWGILIGIMLLILMLAVESMVAQVIMMFMSMVIWLVGASLFTSVIGGSGINCSPPFTNCHNVNIVNTTMAFAWINWSFVMIGLLLSLALAVLVGDQDKNPAPQTRGANPAPASNVAPQGNTTQQTEQRTV